MVKDAAEDAMKKRLVGGQTREQVIKEAGDKLYALEIDRKRLLRNIREIAVKLLMIWGRL